MKIEQQVGSLELARKLKAAGYPQKGICVWKYREAVVSNQGGEWESWRLTDDDRWELRVRRYYLGIEDKEDIIAPTVAELGEKLPDSIYSEDAFLNCLKMNGKWRICYYGCDEEIGRKTADTEADARCKMLLYLHKKGLVKW